MKFTKLSLVAAMLIGSSAFAIENTKVGGDAKLFYHTSDANGNSDIFDKDSSAADVALDLNMATDLVKTDAVSVSAGAGATFLTTLGLENNLVSGVWGGAHTAAGNGSSFGAKVDNASWINEAWLAATAGKTTAKLGRMELDTPLAFTEKWSIEKNTFEAAVAINTDIPDTTLVGAYIGNGNGGEVFGTQNLASGLGFGVVNQNGEFETFGSNGAYAIGAINNSIKPLTLQAWYYDVTRVVEAYWLQADLVCGKIPGLLAGAQYSAHTLSKNAVLDGTTAPLGRNAAKDTDSDVYALMLGYEMKDTFTIKGAYSQVGDDFAAGFNTATGYTSAQSKLYTETVWGGNFGRVTAAGAESYKLSVSTPANGIADLGLSYVNTKQSDKGLVAGAASGRVGTAGELNEIALTASKSFGPLDATVAYINTDVDAPNTDSDNAIQAYLTLNF